MRKPSSTHGSMGRRFFLRGAFGATVGIPFLEGFARRVVSAQEMPTPRFAIFTRQGNGVAQEDAGEPDRYWPTATGRITAASLTSGENASRALSEMARYADRSLFVAGTRFAFPGNMCGHSGGGNQCLTAARVSDSPSGPDSVALGISIDTAIANALNPAGVQPPCLFVGRKSGYLPEVLSYSAPREIRTADNDPFVEYERMLRLSGSDAPEAMGVERLRRQSVNDLVREEMQALLARPDLSRADRNRLDMHFTSIRDLEIALSCRLPVMREMALEGIDPLSAGNYQAVARLHHELIAIGIACGYTRSATLQYGNGNDGTQHVLPGVEVPGVISLGQELPRFHQISHRIYSDGSEGDPIANAQLLHHYIDRMHLQLFVDLCDRLDAYIGPDGAPLLDHGVAVMTNDLAGGVSHSYWNVPWIMVGGCGGFFDVGRYVDLREERGEWVTHNQLLSTILTAVGVLNPDGSIVDDFGDSSLQRGLVPEIMAPGALA
ncbi:MAG: DUF1552 domain-containing protein [Myxococcota bacterium]